MPSIATDSFLSLFLWTGLVRFVTGPHDNRCCMQTSWNLFRESFLVSGGSQHDTVDYLPPNIIHIRRAERMSKKLQVPAEIRPRRCVHTPLSKDINKKVPCLLSQFLN